MTLRWIAAGLLIAIATVVIAAAREPAPTFDEAERRAIAAHGPWPPAPRRDLSNRGSGQPAAIAFGARLFAEPRLSADGRLACATCHRPDRDWTDGVAAGQGAVPLDRRTQPLWNLGHAAWFGWAGQGDSLWAQSIRPILDPAEMASDARRAARLVREDATLACFHRAAFGAEPPEDERVLVDIGKALAAFQETLVSPRTPFDAFRDALIAGDAAGIAAYPDDAKRGLKLFVGRGECAACHFGPRFTTGEFADVGIPFFRRSGGVDPGRFEGIAQALANPFNRLGSHSDSADGAGATRLRHVERQHRNFGEFKIPGLRQVARTGPYMHDGSKPTLESVVEHYSTVSLDCLHGNTERLVRPLGLTPGESADLVAFLRSLSVEAPLPVAPPATCP
ncbi:MAG: hypothetical protein FJX02_03345 [Alphaproteobacteria bacterium]|nr:hypothetical protein [Alphaproteobacteria bacterium]